LKDYALAGFLAIKEGKMPKRIDSSGANGAWYPNNTKFTSLDKKLSQREILGLRVAFLLEEEKLARRET